MGLVTDKLDIFFERKVPGVQQLIVITGLHHVFGAIESQLLVDTGRNFLNPLMSVAIIAQGGAVLGYMVRNMKDAKAKELCIPSFVSVLFGITEPALMNYVIAHVVALGTGFLIRIGINTVNLNGKYFDVQAAVGDQVKMGDIFVTEDIEKIKAEGYDMSVMLIATDANGRKIEKESPGKIKKEKRLLNWYK